MASEILKIDESLSNNTVQSVLRKLLEKKYIEVADIVYSGTVLTRSYRPIVLRKDLLVNQFVDQIKKSDDKIPIPSIVATLLNQEKNEMETIEQLESLLNERKKSLNQDGGVQEVLFFCVDGLAGRSCYNGSRSSCCCRCSL